MESNFDVERKRKIVVVLQADRKDGISYTLGDSVHAWLSRHGRDVRSELPPLLNEDLRECFDLIDTDGSGAIDTDELHAAFLCLGVKMTRENVEAMVNEIDIDGSGEVEYEEFVQLMTQVKEFEEDDVLDEKEGPPPARTSQPAVPFQLLSQAYRRKKLLEAMTQEDEAVRLQTVAKADISMQAQWARRRRITEHAKRQERLRINKASSKDSYNADLPTRLKLCAENALTDSTISDILSHRGLPSLESLFHGAQQYARASRSCSTADPDAPCVSPPRGSSHKSSPRSSRTEPRQRVSASSDQVTTSEFNSSHAPPSMPLKQQQPPPLLLARRSHQAQAHGGFPVCSPRSARTSQQSPRKLEATPKSLDGRGRTSPFASSHSLPSVTESISRYRRRHESPAKSAQCRRLEVVRSVCEAQPQPYHQRFGQLTAKPVIMQNRPGVVLLQIQLRVIRDRPYPRQSRIDQPHGEAEAHHRPLKRYLKQE
ncbi:hypothetical protein CYMTET_51048 [Cymbomonas tetramitiformis]|uniref:EF-hand domain-containing protein n=1 Tax=Cymbomonas tetramitiformis TaxID=36881 RepID=A0AAE0BN28_9CHLO|nr:hypothetical protein CYMTET_51048 [Cymbomonas tetramitiformis]